MALRVRLGCCPGVACSLLSLSWASLRAFMEKAVGLASGIQLGQGTELEMVLPPGKARGGGGAAGLGRAGRLCIATMGERAAPDPLFLPGPLISDGASFACLQGPHSSPSSSPSLIPQSLKGP